jgi:PEP-CTERM motif
MHSCLRPLISPVVMIVGLVALGATNPACAGSLQIWASTSGPPTAADLIASAPSGTSASHSSSSFGGFLITMVTDSSNQPGDPTGTVLAGSSNVLLNLTGSTKTIWITIGDTGFTTPVTPGPIDVTSAVGGSVLKGTAANAMTFQSYVNPSDGQNATTGFTAGPQLPAGLTMTGDSYQNSLSSTISSLSAGYSITETFKITLGAHGSLNFSTSTTLTSSVPEPSGLLLGAIGIVGVLGYGLRRRKAMGA